MRLPLVTVGLFAVGMLLGGCPQAATVGPAFSCTSSTDCAAGWACVDGSCHRRCAVDVDCADANLACVNAVCVPPGSSSSSASSSSGAASSSAMLASSGSSGGASTASSESPSSGDTSSAGASSGSSAPSSSLPASSFFSSSSMSSSSSSGATGPRFTAPLVDIMGGGGMVLWDQGRLQLGAGQAVAGPPVAGPSTTLWPGLLPTVQFP